MKKNNETDPPYDKVHYTDGSPELLTTRAIKDDFRFATWRDILSSYVA